MSQGSIRRFFYLYGLSYSGWQNVDLKNADKKFGGLLESFELKDEEKNNADVSELSNYRYRHPYLSRRGFADEVVLKNGIGFDKKTARVTIPIFFSGKYYGVIKRTTIDEEPKYLYPENLQKGAILYSPKPVNVKRDDIEFWVEGSLDALRFAQAGYYAHAFLGCMPSDIQLNYLKKSKRHPISALDNDAPGIKGTDYVLNKVRRSDLSVLEYPSGIKDPGSMTTEQIDVCVKDCKNRFDLLLHTFDRW
jgi:hypothetical protein